MGDLTVSYLFSLLTHIVKSLDVGRTLQKAFSNFISIVAKKIQLYWYSHVTLFQLVVNGCGSSWRVGFRSKEWHNMLEINGCNGGKKEMVKCSF